MQPETTAIRVEVLMRFKLAEWFEKHPLVLGGNARTVIEHFELQLVVVIVFWNECRIYSNNPLLLRHEFASV